MKRKSKQLCSVLIVLMMLTVLAPTSAFATAVTDVELDKETVYLEGSSNEKVQLNATVKGSEVSQNVTWSSRKKDVATVDANGLVTAEGEGETQIIATSNDNTNISASCTIYVYENALEICEGSASNVKKIYTKEELTQFTQQEVAAYSSYNSYNTYDEKNDIKGPDVRDILSGAGYSVENLDPNSLIRVASYDGLELPYEVGDLFATRYHYPNAKQCVNGRVNATALANKQAVPVVIDLGYKNDNRMCFGQLSPNEQSLTYSVKYMLGGKIIVNAGSPSQLTGGLTANIASGSTIPPGQEIKLSRSQMTSEAIYYTTNGSDPTRLSDIYNYNNYSKSSLRLNQIKAPSTEGTFTVKASVMQYGRKASAVQTFTYTVKKLPTAGKSYTVGKHKYKVTKSATKGGTVTYIAPAKKNNKSITVPKTVKINGYTLSVTAVGSKAFANNKKLKKVTVGANVKTIGSKAFYKDSKLKTIVIDGKNLKKVGSKALKGINAKAKIKVPKSKLKAYKKVFKEKGQKKTVKIVKK